jgi:hypothetical protein
VSIVVGYVKLVLHVVLIGNKAFENTLLGKVCDIRPQLLEYFWDWFNPNNTQSTLRVQFSLLTFVRTDMNYT